MREEIQITFKIGFDVPAELPLSEQAESARSFLTDVLLNAVPGDTATGPETLFSVGGATIDGEPLAEAEIYGNNGRARKARTRAGFDGFTVQRCAEVGDHCAPIGWSFPRDAESVFWTVYGYRDGTGAQAIGDYRSRASALCMADALADGRAVDCPDSMLPGFRVSWETVTDESAEAGDADARGFIRADSGALEPLEPSRLDRDGDLYLMPLRGALEALEASGEPWRVLEAVEADCSDTSAARSVRAVYRLDGPAQDLPGGDAVRSFTLSIHFPENMTPASRARLCALICK